VFKLAFFYVEWKEMCYK